MYRFLFVFAALSISLAACSAATEQLASNDEEDESQEESEESTSPYPSWFTNDTEISSDSTSFYAYGSAIDSDSTQSISKSETQAREQFAAGISDKMEELRNEAVNDEGDDSALAEPSFIMALRNAEQEISEVPQVEEAEGEPREDVKGYRGFVELTVSKEEITGAFDEELSSHSEAWEQLKSSEAYSDL